MGYGLWVMTYLIKSIKIKIFIRDHPTDPHIFDTKQNYA